MSDGGRSCTTRHQGGHFRNILRAHPILLFGISIIFSALDLEIGELEFFKELILVLLQYLLNGGLVHVQFIALYCS